MQFGSKAKRDGHHGGWVHAPRAGYLMALCAAVGFGSGAFFQQTLLPILDPADARLDYRLLRQAWEAIEGHYVDRAAIKSKPLTYGAISGMVDALGDTDHSAFLTPEMLRLFGASERGELKGIGAEVRLENRRVMIVAALDHSPAQRAGLKSGDAVVSVDGKDVAGMPLEHVVELISGKPGTTVRLGILEPRRHALHDVTVERAELALQRVTWAMLPGTRIADVRIAVFGDGVERELRGALERMRQEGAVGMILDLRDNPGGELSQAVAAASEFLTHGNVLLIKDAEGRIAPMPVQPGGLDVKLPLAVLIDGGSASAAEIVAGALRDAHRGELIGQTTFGTGTVLSEFKLTDGSALLLAVREWLTPNGDSFWHKGIPPEMVVSLPADVEPLFPSAERNLTADQLRGSHDDQLQAGLKWVEEQVRTEQAKAASGTGHVERAEPQRGMFWPP